MGPHRNDKGTYSKQQQAPLVKEEGRRNRYKQRKAVPQFSNLFLPKDENRKTQDLFDSSLGETTKPTDAFEDLKSKALRKPLAVNSLLTNSTFGSLGQISENDTFDKLFGGGNKLAIRTSRNTNGGLFSSSNSSFDATGVLFQSLRCEAPANSLCSAGDRLKSQFIKKEIGNSRNAYDSHAGIPEEEHCNSDKIPVGNDKSQLSGVCMMPVSPQLFSSIDEKREKTKLSGKKKRKSNRAPKGRKAVESSIKHIYDKSGKQSYDGNFNCDKECFTTDSQSPINQLKKPFIKIECSPTACRSPQLENGLLAPNKFGEFTGTPCSKNFAKAFLQQKYLSQNGLSETSQASQGSQGSGKSSAKSDVLTSTPADVSRSKSLANSMSPWNIKIDAMLEHTISPVLQEKNSVTETNSPSDFQSPMSFKVKSTMPSYQKSRTSPSHGSHYQTCFSDKCGTSDGKQGCWTRSNEGEGNVGQRSFYNSSLELRSGPFKGITIPVFDPTGRMKNESSKKQSLESSPDEYPQKGAQSVVQSSPELHIALRNRNKTSQKRFIDQVIQVSGGVVLQEMSKNLSAEKLKQINSFLNRQSFTKPRKTRQQNTQFRIKRAEPSSGVRRLTRRTARLSKLQKNRDAGNTDTSGSISQKENVNTDESTTTEPSIIIPRKKPNFALKSNKLGLLHVKTDMVNSSSDSVSTNCSVISKNNYATYASDAYFARPSPVLTRRASVRLAGKRKNADSSSSYSNKSFGSKLGKNMAYISTRSATKRLQNTRKQLSIMQFSLSSAPSVHTDLEETGYSVASNNAVSDKGSVVCTKIKREQKSFHTDSDECGEESSQPYDAQLESSAVQNYSLEREPLENQVIKEECEDSDVALDDDKIPRDERIHGGDRSQAKYPLTVSFKTTQVSFKEDHGDFSAADLSVGEVFELPFQTAVQAKRGKGWLRSLSVARASFIGEEQLQDNIRRQTVHRMSMSVGVRRMTQLRMLALPEMTEKMIQEMGESYSEAGDYLSRSILCDPRRHVLMLCSQVEPIPITDCFTESRLSCCKKIGEGVYGEVFMTMPNPNSMEGATVLKIMPIEGDFDVNGEPQKKFEEILSEIIISLELSNLRKTKEGSNWTDSFVHVLNCWCVEGSYAHDMLHLWDLYHEDKGSENDRPDIFSESQLYIVLEFTHGGRDLEGYVFNNASQSLVIFLQIAYSLAVAEQELEFEHRDLHWGNVLVASTKESSVDFKISGGTYTLQTQGVKATVIDFTLSRLKAPHCVMYNNLAEDPSLFTAQGDYQFEIYRQMKKANRNEWQSFTPYTNVLWLHYILDKMINECYYKNVKTKVHKTNMDRLHKLKQTMLDSESATAFVLRREFDLA